MLLWLFVQKQCVRCFPRIQGNVKPLNKLWAFVGNSSLDEQLNESTGEAFSSLPKPPSNLFSARKLPGMSLVTDPSPAHEQHFDPCLCIQGNPWVHLSSESPHSSSPWDGFLVIFPNKRFACSFWGVWKQGGSFDLWFSHHLCYSLQNSRGI